MLKKLVAGSLAGVIILSLTGCDSATQSAPGNTTMSGAAVGGLSGAAIGALVDKKNPGTGALIGGAAGAVGGGLIGNQMEKNRQNAQYQQQSAYQQGYQDAQAPPPKKY